jgi:hypothetical protein
MSTHLAHDPGYLALSRHLYWAQEAGSRTEVGTRQVREDLLEFVARMRTDERLVIPLGEPHLSASTPWKRAMKYAMFRIGRFGTRRYDRLLGDGMDLTVSLAERVIELEGEVEMLRDHLDRLRSPDREEPA